MARPQPCCYAAHTVTSLHVARASHTMATQYWLMKSEPDEASIDTLHAEGTLPWTGVRNYQFAFSRQGMGVKLP
jgi:hypothetical protein